MDVLRYWIEIPGICDIWDISFYAPLDESIGYPICLYRGQTWLIRCIACPEGVQNQWFGVLRIWPLLDIWMLECSNPGTPRNTLNGHRGKYTWILRFRGYRGIWGPWVPTHRGSKIHEFEVYLTPWDGIYQNWSGLYRIGYFWYLATDPSSGFRGAPEMLRGVKYRVRKGSEIGYPKRVLNTTK